MKKLKILLVDDDDDDRQFFADALNCIEMHTELLQVKNGQSCLNFLKENIDDAPNLIFLDLNMPIMNGFCCLEKIRANEKHKKIIIAIYSTSSSDMDIEETFNKGANIYFTKPSSFIALKSSLKKVVKTNWTYQLNNFNRENFILKL